MKSSVVTLFTNSDINLLLASETAKNTDIYGNLYSTLQHSNASCINSQNITSLNFDKTAINVINSSRKELINNISNEWYVTQSTSISDTHCQLCNARNKYICYIRNKNNNKVLHIGTSCVHKFPHIEGANDALKRVKQTKANELLIMRKNDFISHIGDPIPIFQDLEVQLSSIPIVLPLSLEHGLSDSFTSLKDIYAHWLKYGIPSIAETTEQFFNVLHSYQNTYKEALSFINQNHSTPLICKRQYGLWLKQHNKEEVYNNISQNNGIFTLQCLQHLYDSNFLKEHQYLLDNFLSIYSLKIYTITDSSIEFIFYNEDKFHNVLIFQMPTESFMYNIGSYIILSQTPPTLIYNLPTFKLTPSLNSFDTIYLPLKRLFRNQGYDIRLRNSNYTDTFYFRLSDESILPAKHNYIFNILKNSVFQSNYTIAKSIHNIIGNIKRSKNWISKEQQEKFAGLSITIKNKPE
ncbi:MAG: hypothetical protein E7256_06650 [Lachnospiraceae bacterium]|nr:hypothetical protein [Lachnospiraceae bacterium]